MEIFNNISICEVPREGIQARNYENFILELMNKSKKVFPFQYEHIVKQSHGECDYIEQISGQKFDAKLLLSNEQCQNLAGSKGEAWEWLTSLLNVQKSSTDIMLKKSNISETWLYEMINKRLQSVNSDEHAILYIPFPIVYDVEGSVFLQFAADILSVTYEKIVQDKPELVQGKNTYVIYPGLYGKYVLRNLNKPHIKEFICEENKFFDYQCYFLK